MSLLARRRAMMGAKKMPEYDLMFQANTTIQGTIDGHDVSISYWPSSGTRQIQVVSRKTITLNPGDTIGLKYSKTGSVNPTGYMNVFFWAKTPNGGYAARSINSNFDFSDKVDEILQLTASETLIGTKIGFESRAAPQSYNPTLKLHIDMYVNGRKLA